MLKRQFFCVFLLSYCCAAAQNTIQFNRHIRPILSDNCFKCHGPDGHQRKAKLRFDTEEGATAELKRGRAIVPGDPSKSLMMSRLTTTDTDKRMPPAETGKELTPAQIKLIRDWIKQGAKYQEHWAYVPPKVADTGADSLGEIDRLIRARLDSRGLKPSPEADRITLIRRLSFDLTGLPPSAKEVNDFVSDRSANAYEKLVDRLLRSQHYGERMAIYWLDLVRYADTVGYHGDQDHAISPYRDYVIRAFNDNMPFDRFTREQLAGDLLPDPTISQRVATGYNRVLQTSHEGGVQRKEYLAKYSADRVRNFVGVWLGATMGCAECHDHKYDPFTKKDFYSLAAFFADVDDNRTFRGTNSLPTRREPELRILSEDDVATLAKLEARQKQLKKKKLPKPGEEIQEEDLKNRGEVLKNIQAEIRRIKAKEERTMVTVAIKPREIRILKRGDWMDTSGEVVQPAVPHFLKSIETTGRATRLDLANWLTSPDNPLTARVFMNRLWYLFFGIGISKNLDDLGSQGEWPTHPQLIDNLAVRFMKSNWNIRQMVKMLVMTKTYKQSSLESPRLRELDPENRLFARQSRFRLPAEMIRDNVLAVSGLLNRNFGGKPARPYQPAGYYRPLNFPRRTYKSDTNKNQYRRGVYMHWQRQFLHPMLRAFDAPTREECTAQRPSSNTPLAALTTLNDPTFVEAARAFAARILDEGGSNVDDRIQWAWQEALSRPPSDAEEKVAVSLYRSNRAVYAKDAAAAGKLLKIGMAPVPSKIDRRELAAWTAVARAVFNLNESITRN
ncbi:MAG: PSD1 and planctomycete cytochrome C domain-containing protein [Planctomycetota bacterium]|jgi:hypothetical protein|nr:PSD1 and planctomycete cytochrome C domain-containing protein [Planctomycetota bacterium]MDP7253021.1 PSD1 and planctomycete cytochrome C domain-containing protein [Planctomycetota bacterium]